MSVTAGLPRDIQCTVEVYHLGTSNGAQPYSTSADLTVSGGKMPLSVQNRVILGGDRIATFLLIVDNDEDIREGDKIVIGSDEYRVNNVDTHAYGTLAHKEIVLATV